MYRFFSFVFACFIIVGPMWGQSSDCPRGPVIRIPITSLTKSPQPGMMVLTDSCLNQYYVMPDSVYTAGDVVNQYFSGDTLVTILNNGDTLISISNSITGINYQSDTLCIYTAQGDTFCTVIAIEPDTSGTGRVRLQDNLGVEDTLWTNAPPAAPDNLGISNAVRLESPNTIKWGGDLVDATTTVHSPDSTHNVTWQDLNIMRGYMSSMRIYPWSSFILDGFPNAYFEMKSRTSFYIRADTVLHFDLFQHGLTDTSHLLIRTDRVRKDIAKNGSVLQLLQEGSGTYQGNSDWTPYAFPLTAPPDTGLYALHYDGDEFSFNELSDGGLPSGTVLNSTLRWDGSAWVENDSLLVNSDGDAGMGGSAIQTTRSITTPKDIQINGIRIGKGGGSVSTNTLMSAGGLNINTTGNRNVSVGISALAQNTSGGENTAIGAYTIQFGSTTARNTCIGAYAGNLIGTGGNDNTYIGYFAGGAASSTKSQNVFIGSTAGGYSTAGRSVIIGYQAGSLVNKDSTLVIHYGPDTIPTLVGDFRQKRIGINRNIWGIEQTLDVGGTARVRSSVDTATVNALWGANTVGDLKKVNLGSDIIIQGDSIKVNVPALPAGSVLNSTLRWDGSAWVENDSLLVNADGDAGMGGSAIQTTRSITTPKDIQINGIRAGSGGDTTCTIFGRNASVGTSPNQNTAIGHQAMQNTTSGQYNTAIGSLAGKKITTGTWLVAVGYAAMAGTGNATGNYNVAVGGWAGQDLTTAAGCVAVGYNALRNNTSSGSNIGIGYEALRTMSGAGVTFNTAIGHEVGYNATGLQGSTFIGAGAGYNSTSKHSVFIGRNAGFFVTKDSTLIIEPTSDTIATIVADFEHKKVGINRNPHGIAQTLDVGGTARVRQDVTMTPTHVWAANSDGDFKKLIIGDGLGVVGDTLKVSYQQPNEEYPYIQALLSAPYADTVNYLASSPIRYDVTGWSRDWALNNNWIEYLGLDTFICKIDCSITLKADAGGSCEITFHSDIWGELFGYEMDLSAGINTFHVGNQLLYPIPQVDSSYGDTEFSVQIKNTSGATRVYTIQSASIIAIKVAKWVPLQ